MFRTSQRIIPPVIVLVLATLGALEIRLPGVEYSDSPLISAMLALIAIDAFVDRVEPVPLGPPPRPLARHARSGTVAPVKQ
ncbi:hypothetical protein [Streptomyces sp. NPDC003036]|uniref:hypothetical protein n=1 Tax=Streptomyces sp. NPDC003036 TaxID=3154442 RepID=UPI0033B7FEAD